MQWVVSPNSISISMKWYMFHQEILMYFSIVKLFPLACYASKVSAAGYTISIPIWSSFIRPILQVISLHFDDDAFWWPFLHISIKYECELHSVKSSVIHNNIPQVNQSSMESATIDVHWKYNAWSSYVEAWFASSFSFFAMHIKNTPKKLYELEFYLEK